jgi:hypothetical protein
MVHCHKELIIISSNPVHRIKSIGQPGPGKVKNHTIFWEKGRKKKWGRPKKVVEKNPGFVKIP